MFTNYRNDFPKLHSSIFKKQKKKCKISLDIANMYFKSLNKSSGECDKIAISETFINYLISINLLCNSNLLIEYVEIIRKNKHLITSQEMIKKIKKLNIHRASFKLLAMIITTYCSLGINCYKDRARECMSYAVEFYDLMKNKYKYKPNTYLFNTLLNALRKSKMKHKFWDIVQLTIDEKHPSFDSFTYGCLMEQSIEEKNYQKFASIYKEFEGREFEKTKNSNYIYSLNTKVKKLEEIEIEKHKKWLKVGIKWHEFVR